MKTILAPTDFSDVSENAVDYAAELALFAKAKLIILNGYAIPVPVAYDVPVVSIPFEEMEEQSKKLLKNCEKRLKKKHPSLETELVSKAGFVVDEILKVENERKTDLTVMGVTVAGKSEALSGSNTTTVERVSASPVIVVPVKAKFKVPEKVALACDFKSIVPDHVVSKFKEIVHLFKAKVLVFDVLKKAELVSYASAASEVNLENSLGGLPHSIYFPSGDDVVAETNEFIEKNHVDMLVVMPHNYSFFSKLFHHSETKKMSLHTHIPLLSIHE
jgi:nucleotide-binding universal stress UspA family protein